MLERLIIENIALIEKLDLELSDGFTVLTGETGAGKSIIIDGLNLVLGSRGSRELISYGKQKCRAEAIFSIDGDREVEAVLKDMELDTGEDELSIMRELSVNGKSLCRVNGTVIPLASLKRITDLLVDIHGQHEHQSLLDEKNHLDVIDRYSEDTIAPLKEDVNSIYSDYSAVCSRLNAGFLSEAERERRIDILKYQINEISSAQLLSDEDKAIKDELILLTNAEKITENLNSASERLNGSKGILEELRNAVDELSKVSDFSDKYEAVFTRLNDLYYEIEDASYTVRDMTFELEYDPKRIDELEMRLDTIDALKHKYGNSIEEILGFLSSAEAELEELTGDASKRDALQRKRAELKDEYAKAAETLTEARKASAEKLCRLSEEQLRELGMKKARLSAEFTKIDDEPREGGADMVCLLLSANEGEPLKPLSKVASGGELSRIMLALKTVITDADGIPTLVFDEVDTGISGSTANTVGIRMKHIAGKHQVLCVTHLPQIAAFADSHFVVSKHEENGKTFTNVKQLAEDERAAELARIMGAEQTSTAAVEHATELIKKARTVRL